MVAGTQETEFHVTIDHGLGSSPLVGGSPLACSTNGHADTPAVVNGKVPTLRPSVVVVDGGLQISGLGHQRATSDNLASPIAVIDVY